MAASETHQRDRINAIGNSLVMRKETRVELKPVGNAKDSQEGRDEAERCEPSMPRDVVRQWRESATTGRWQFFSMVDVDSVQLPGSGRWVAVAHLIRLRVGNAALRAILAWRFTGNSGPVPIVYVAIAFE